MSTALDLKTKEEKNAELDKRIEALRKKNEALVKRYQEIEEDKKRAEQEGIAVTTPRKPREALGKRYQESDDKRGDQDNTGIASPKSHLHDSDVQEKRNFEKENFTMTVEISKSSREKRVINDRKSSSQNTPWNRVEPGDFSSETFAIEQSPSRRGSSGRGIRNRGGRGARQEARRERGETPHDVGETFEGRSPRGGRGRRGMAESGGIQSGQDRKTKEWEEKRRQNIEKMNEEMEKIAEYERGQRGDGTGEKNPIRNFLDDPRRSGPILEVDRKEGSRRHFRNWGGLDFEKVKTGNEREKEWTNRRPVPKVSSDMTMSMTGRERAEYMRWKKEREQIDQERLARHRNATGQWRREWDAQKSDGMFKEEAGESVGQGQDQDSWRDDGRPRHKAPTFGDFMPQSKMREPVKGRSQRKGRGPANNYSMHDNRWVENEEDKMLGELKMEDSACKKSIMPPESAPEIESHEDDEDQWEDEEDEVVVVGEGDEEEEEEAEQQEKSSTSVPISSAETKKKVAPVSVPMTTKVKERPKPARKRKSNPKLQISNVQRSPACQTSSETKPPLSPFSPQDCPQGMSWGDQMDLQSPRSSLGDSPLRLDSTGEGFSPGKPQRETEEVVSIEGKMDQTDISKCHKLKETSETVSVCPEEEFIEATESFVTEETDKVDIPNVENDAHNESPKEEEGVDKQLDNIETVNNEVDIPNVENDAHNESPKEEEGVDKQLDNKETVNNEVLGTHNNEDENSNNTFKDEMNESPDALQNTETDELQVTTEPTSDCVSTSLASQPSSGVVQITSFQTVAFRKNSLELAEL
ncbi:coiled-coil domain-containing protein 9 isoform X2 [Erpetoichthys calabaricus]|uniref:coiled-coil domain-containing protein 9 isoform X2 n=1 Tax=Erpetoichthys calabaricus TaxID=27687 RepID=UPI002234825C|nr:coiled-coil domain-containing protein 9 isoform X2 [Erpetoichthys calabaricus]